MAKLRQRRHKRIRAKIFGTAERPRLSVFRSNQYIYGQLVDDVKGRTLAAVNDIEELKNRTPHQNKLGTGQETEKQKNKKEISPMMGKTAVAYETGKLMAKKAQEKGIKKAVFDRGGYRYHGRVKAFAQGAREGGLQF